MNAFVFTDTNQTVTYLLSQNEWEGVKRIAKVHAEDFEAVTGVCPQVRTVSVDADQVPRPEGSRLVLIGTVGVSSLIDSLARICPTVTEGLSGKREVYRMTTLEPKTLPLSDTKDPALQALFSGTREILVIAGSDKRGTIYGIFKLSELFGVSPWIWWADVTPKHCEELVLSQEALNFLSKEPSVRYRGFFINDEWPSFGSWTTEKFGDFNAAMYDKLFQLLLRLKGNYLWPAMWSASFPLDGPGLGNVELADLYGVVMGESHHEPCCRASEEWDKVRGVDTVYGNEWNFYTNRDGLLRYWDEALLRNSKYETMITIGMRGERDSSMLGDHSSLGQNIDLLKDIITEQNKLIRKNVNEDLSKVPRLLALYKEVEGYYYGDENTPGLIDFQELDGVTIMLCEDNYGNMRTLPPKELRNRDGGWGMYYHFDYHGGPISYEWVNSTPLTKVWEQMSMAYDYGIRDVWIVNVGDLKPQELPLSYFLDLAYDFEAYGTSAPNSTHEYTKNWVKQQFPFAEAAEKTDEITSVLEEYTRINGMRRPEAMNQDVYPADRGNEADYMLRRADRVLTAAKALLKTVPKTSYDAFWQLVYFPAAASMTVQRMSLLATLSVQRAKEHSKLANKYAALVREAIATDKELIDYYNSTLSGGKWKGMMSSKHIGFQSWNDERWFYPVTASYTPVNGAKLLVYPVAPDRFPRNLRPFELLPFVLTRAIGSTDDFVPRADSLLREIRLVNAGDTDVSYTVDCDADWIFVEADSDTVAEETVLRIKPRLSSLTKAIAAQCPTPDKAPDEAASALPDSCIAKAGTLQATLTISGAGASYRLPVTAQTYELMKGCEDIAILNNRTAILPAASYTANEGTADGAEWKLLTDYGFAKDAIKAYPTTEFYDDATAAPSLLYCVYAPEAGEYEALFRIAPSNHLTAKIRLRFALSVNNQGFEELETIPEGFLSGSHWSGPWCQNVLDNYRLVRKTIRLQEGPNNLLLAALDAGVVLQEILVR